MLKILTQIVIALIGLICIISVGLYIDKIPTDTAISKLLSKDWIKMGISYIIGIIIFLIGLKIISIFL